MVGLVRPGPRFEPERGTRAMHGRGKSDGFVVPAKSSNNIVGAPTAAEGMEGRGPAKGNLAAAKRVRTQRRVHPPIEPRRVRRAAMLARSHPRQEPGAVIPPAGICAGGGGQPPSLPRQLELHGTGNTKWVRSALSHCSLRLHFRPDRSPDAGLQAVLAYCGSLTINFFTRHALSHRPPQRLQFRERRRLVEPL